MKRIWTLTLVIAMLLSTAACSKGGDGSYVPTGDGLAYDEDYTGAVNRPDAPEQIQVLTLTYYPQKSLNPLKTSDFTNRTLFSLIYQSLFVVDRDCNVSPMLCGKYTVSEDMRSYTFFVDEKATFSDGTPVTLEDVSASLHAAWDCNYYKGRFTHVLSIELPETGGLKINLDTPFENLPLLLDMPIMKADQVDAELPLGSGPYILDASSDPLRLRRRNDWWCKAEMAVTAPAITLIPAESPTQIRDNFQFNGLSLVCADPGSDNYADYRCDYELWECETGLFLYLAFNQDSETFEETAVRAAVTYVVDRETLAAEFFRGFGRGTTLPVSPNSPYYSEGLAEKYNYDLLRFAQVVSNYGLQGAPVVFLVNKDDTLRLRTARAIADKMTEAGLAVTMKEVSTSQFTYAVRMREFDIYLGQTKLSPNMDLSAFFNTTGVMSYGGVDDIAAYALCLQALENHGNYYTLYKTVMDNGLLVPVLFHNYAIYATRGLLTSLTPSRDNVFYYTIGKTMDEIYIDDPIIE